MAKAKRRIHEFNFKGDGCHVALVDKAANLQEVLTMKAAEDEVQVTLSMREFLSKFFGLWYEDAAILAGVLGYSTKDTASEDVDTYDDYINSKIDTVQLLKGADLPKTLPESIASKVEELQKQFGDNLKETSEGLPFEDNINIEKGESHVDKTEISKEELVELKKAADEASLLKAELQEMETLKSKLAGLVAEKETKAKEDMVEVVKAYSFVTEEDQTSLVEYLLKAEGAEVILKALESARNAITEAVEIEVVKGDEGGDINVEEVTTDKAVDLTSEILKNRNS